ncbi:MAG: SdrD B-like domain-containing protein [bacterium]
MNRVSRFLLLVAALGLLALGCSQQSDTLAPEDAINMAIRAAMPPGATLQSATFYIYSSAASNRQVDVYRATAAWGEATVTWNSFGAAYTGMAGSFMTDGVGWRSVNVTALVQDWMDGTYDNHGLLLDQAVITYPRSVYPSRENASRNPYLEICYDDGGGTQCEQIMANADAYITEYHPDNNFGLLDVLFTGYAADNDLEKQTLVMFDIPTEEPRLAAIGDFVWLDADEDGIQDPGELGIPGVTVNLYSCADVLLATTITDASGLYMFTGLTPGDYYVEFVIPAGYNVSPQDQGADDAVDSDADPSSGRTVCTTLDAGEVDDTWDCGLYDEPDYGECDGKVTQLTIRYDGSIVNAHIVVKMKKNLVVFDGIVQPGEQFTFVGADKHGTLGPETYYYVNGVLNTNIHTSCSQPIGPGLTKGDFTVIEGYSRHGGLLPPL